MSMPARPTGDLASTEEPGHVRKPWVWTVGAFLVYCLLALPAYWPILQHPASRIVGYDPQDQAWQVWLLRWVPYALAHGHNPLFSNWTNYPFGINLAQNTNMPLLGLIMAPVSVLVSPVVSYNLLLWLSFPLSAVAMFWVLRRWTGSLVAAFVGGLLYGFSAYVVGQGLGHVMFSFVPLPPLYFYQLHKLVVRREGSPVRDGLILGAIAVAQFFISAEVLLDLAILSAIAIVILILGNYREVTATAARYVLRGLVAGAGLVIVFVAYPLWYMLRGPQHYVGLFRPVNAYRATLLDAVTPTRAQYFAPSWSLLHYGTYVDYLENGSYLGIPLLVLTILLLVWFRRNRWMIMSTLLAISAYALSMGTNFLVMNGPNASSNRPASVPMPLGLLTHLPLVAQMIPDRLSLYVTMFITITVALGLSELIRMTANGRVQRSRQRRSYRALQLIAAALTGLVLVSLVPRWPYYSVPTAVPAFFTSKAAEQIPSGSVILTYPFPSDPNDQAMLWEAVGAMRFREVGGYALIRGPDGRPTVWPWALRPADVQDFLVREQQRDPIPVAFSSVRGTLEADVRVFLSRYNVRAVIISRTGRYAGTQAVVDLFTRALGRPPVRVGGVDLWSGVDASDHVPPIRPSNG
jgi:hypothetical protein